MGNGAGGGKAVRSKTDYILGTDRRLFMNVSVRDPRHNSDHYMVKVVLRGGTETAHKKYIAGRRRVPMQVNRGGERPAPSVHRGMLHGARRRSDD